MHSTERRSVKISLHPHLIISPLRSRGWPLSHHGNHVRPEIDQLTLLVIPKHGVQGTGCRVHHAQTRRRGRPKRTEGQREKTHRFLVNLIKTLPILDTKTSISNNKASDRDTRRLFSLASISNRQHSLLSSILSSSESELFLATTKFFIEAKDLLSTHAFNRETLGQDFVTPSPHHIPPRD